MYKIVGQSSFIQRQHGGVEPRVLRCVLCIVGAVALAEFIADSPRLLRIDLRENDIKTGGLMALSLSLKVSETVTRIDLDKEPKRESVSTPGKSRWCGSFHN